MSLTEIVKIGPEMVPIWESRCFSEGDEYTIIKISKAAKSGTNRLVVLAKWVRQEWYTTYKNFPK